MRSKIHGIEVVDDATVAILRRMTNAERFAMVDQMWRVARDATRENLQREHPDWKTVTRRPPGVYPLTTFQTTCARRYHCKTC